MKCKVQADLFIGVLIVKSTLFPDAEMKVQTCVPKVASGVVRGT